MKYDIGDLVIVNNPMFLVYNGVIIDRINNNDWYGGGYYLFHWEYYDNYDQTKDNKVGFSLLNDWVRNKEVIVYPVAK